MQTRRFTPRAASAARYARAQGGIEQNEKEADREVHDFRFKLTTSKCQDLHAPIKQPGRRMHVRNIYHRKDGEQEQCCILWRSEIKPNISGITPPVKRCVVSSLTLVLQYRLGRADFDFCVRFENTASCINARRHAGSRQLCLLACVVAL